MNRPQGSSRGVLGPLGLLLVALLWLLTINGNAPTKNLAVPPPATQPTWAHPQSLPSPHLAHHPRTDGASRS